MLGESSSQKKRKAVSPRDDSVLLEIGKKIKAFANLSTLSAPERPTKKLLFVAS